MATLKVPIDGNPGDEVSVRIWDSQTTGIDQGTEAEHWATRFLSKERPGRYRLVRMPDNQRRSAKMGLPNWLSVTRIRSSLSPRRRSRTSTPGWSTHYQ